MIGVPNLGIGNFASVLRMVERVGGQARLLASPHELVQTDKIILAGVGAFDTGMGSLQQGGWEEPLREAVGQGKPTLGICLGMQLMCRSSEEGRLPGLGWIDGQVERFRFPEDSRLKVPHMGWNTVTVTRPNRLLPSGNGEQRFYFVHSYHVRCEDPSDVTATADHGLPFTAAIARGNVLGVQFHLTRKRAIVSGWS
jgi:glutamine amidotransferase